ncbi:hypothetical protein FRC11_002387, partial [Ceratobasidium sp. 423]
MTDSESETGLQPRRSMRTPVPSKKVKAKTKNVYEGDSRAKPAERWEDNQRKKTIERKRAAAAMDATSSPGKRPPTSEMSTPSPRKKQKRTSASVDDEEPGRKEEGKGKGKGKEKGKGKGKGKEPATPAATLAKGGRRLLTPIQEDDDDPLAQFAHPGPRPRPTDDPVNDGVILEEWQRQRLIWYLVERDGRPVDPDFDYDELKKILGLDGNWDSDDDSRDASLFAGGPSGAPASGPTAAATADSDSDGVGRYDEEPAPRKPIGVKALTPPPAEVAKPHGNQARKSHTTTNLFERKSTDDSDNPEKRPQAESPKQGTSKSTSKPKPQAPTSKLVILESGSHAAGPSSQSSTSGKSQAAPRASEFPHSQPQSSRPSQPPGNSSWSFGAPAPERDSWPPSGFSGPYPPAQAPRYRSDSQAPGPYRDQFAGPQGPPGSGYNPSQVPPSHRPSESSLPYRHSSVAPAYSNPQRSSQNGESWRHESHGGREEPQERSSRSANHPNPSNQSQQRKESSSSSNQGRRSGSEVPSHRSKKSGSKQVKNKQASASSQRSKSQNRNKDRTPQRTTDREDDGMDADEDEPAEGSKKGSSRGRLKDFKGVEKRILNWAGRTFIALMVSKGMYETDVKVIDRRRLKAWLAGCEICEVDPEDYPIAPAHVENLDDRLCTWRSRARDHMIDHVRYHFFN